MSENLTASSARSKPSLLQKSSDMIESSESEQLQPLLSPSPETLIGTVGSAIGTSAAAVADGTIAKPDGTKTPIESSNSQKLQSLLSPSPSIEHQDPELVQLKQKLAQQRQQPQVVQGLKRMVLPQQPLQEIHNQQTRQLQLLQEIAKRNMTNIGNCNNSLGAWNSLFLQQNNSASNNQKQPQMVQAQQRMVQPQQMGQNQLGAGQPQMVQAQQQMVQPQQMGQNQLGAGQLQMANGQPLPATPAMGMVGNGAVPWAPQMISTDQLRKQLLAHQIARNARQGQNAQISGLAQNGQLGMMQNAISEGQLIQKQLLSLQQQQLLLQQIHIQQQLASYNNSVGLKPQQLSEILKQQAQIEGPGARNSLNLTPVGISREGTETSNQLLRERKIQDLVSQVTTLACTLAKHPKSSTLESKDVFPHPGGSTQENLKGGVCVFNGHQSQATKSPKSSEACGKCAEMIPGLLRRMNAQDATINDLKVRHRELSMGLLICVIVILFLLWSRLLL